MADLTHMWNLTWLTEVLWLTEADAAVGLARVCAAAYAICGLPAE